jgi:Flp pilus assembly protein TadG
MKFDFFSVFLFVFIVLNFACPQTQASMSAQISVDKIEQVDVLIRLLNMDE